MPTRSTVSVPTTPIAAPAIRNTRMIAPREAPTVRRMAISLPLSFTSMIRARNDVQRRDQHDQGQDNKHDIALDLKCSKKGRGTPSPVDEEHRPPGGVNHGLAEAV